MDTIFDDIKTVAEWVCDRGWADANAGNFSINYHSKIPERFICSGKMDGLRGNTFCYLTSAAGSRMADMKTVPGENVVFIQSTGNEINVFSTPDGLKRPTSEWQAHVLSQEVFNEPGKALLHVHPVEIISITHDNRFCSADKLSRLVWSMQPEAVALLPTGVGFVPYMLTGSPELAEATARAFQKHPVVVWEKHGILAASMSLKAAFDLVDVVVKSLKIYFLCKKSGFDPEGLTTEQVRELREYFQK